MESFNLLGKIEKNQKYKDLGKLFIKAGANHYDEKGLEFIDNFKNEKDNKFSTNIYIDYSQPYVTIYVIAFN